jgi:hypothetical protein
MNLNFDMLGSPNHAKFVYDGNFDASTHRPALRPSTRAPRRSSRPS